MTVATKIMMGSGAVESGYEIEQSAIFNGNSGLYRTPSSTGNRRTWTLSFWAKRNTLGGWQNIIGGQHNTPASYVYFNADNQIAVHEYQSGVPTNYYTETTRVFRDVGAWYHIVVNFDSTQGTAANRMKIWINGVQETSFDVLISPSQNFQTQHNLASIPQYVGRDYTTSSFFKGQLAEMHWLDGVTKPASNFGETNDDTGQWIPKEYEGGSYGTNGYYLKFVSGAIGTDSSGNGNNHTVQSLSNSEIVPDSPTNNFATLDPLNFVGTNGTINYGNLNVVGGNYPAKIFPSTIAALSGKWYAEFTQAQNQYPLLGVADADLFRSLHNTGGIRGSGAVTWDLGSTLGRYFINSTSETASSGKGNNGDVIQIAFDADSRKVWFGINNTWNASGNPAAGSNQIGVVDNTGPLLFFMRPESTTQTANFGQRTLAYTPPSGFLALSTGNLPDPAIPLPSAHFNTVIWTGNDANNRTIPVGFAPDLTWFKQRTGNNSLALFDTVRGNSNPNGLSSNSNSQEFDWTGIFKGHTSNGFTVDSGTASNHSSHTYVGWNWKANGSGSQNTDGSINSTATSANQTAGFSIVTYTGNNQAATVGHGLGVAPDLVIVKSTSNSGAWHVYNGVTSSDSENYYMTLDSTIALTNSGTGTVPWNNTRATTSVFSVGGANASTNINTRTYVAYCFASKPGFSKIDTYVGNGNVNGPFVNTGFKPAFVITKRYSTIGRWTIEDNKRDPFNEVVNGLYANANNSDSFGEGGYWDMDFLSNGFKIRATDPEINGNGADFLYIAFAESPFKTANAR